MANIKDVARDAGVAVSTVSAVLNGTKYVSPGLRDRVLSSVKRLNYLPNDLGRSLVAQQSFTVGLAFPVFSYIMLEALLGAQSIIDPSPYHLLLLSKAYTAEELLELFRRRRIDGAMLFQRHWQPSECRLFLEAGMPFVVTTLLPGEASSFPTVAVDDLKGAAQGVNYLCGLGHRRIGFIGGPRFNAASELRHQGFVAAVRDHGLNPEQMPCLRGAADEVEGHSLAADLMSRPDRPTAILVAHDHIAVGCYRAAHELGLRIPDDVSILSYDHSVLARGLQPALTAVEHSMEEKGARAARMLLDMIAHPEQPPRQIILPTRLVVRESTSAPSTRVR